MVPSYWRQCSSLLGILFLVALVWGVSERGANSRTHNELDGLRRDGQKAQEELAVTREVVKRLNETCGIKEKALQGLRSELDTAEAKAVSSERTAEDLRGKLEKQKEDAEKELATALEKVRKEAEQHKSTETAQQEKATTNTADTTGRIATLTQELEKAQSELKTAEQNAAQLRERESALKKEVIDKDKEIARLKELGTKVWEDLTAAKKQNEELTKELSSTRDDAARPRRKK